MQHEFLDRYSREDSPLHRWGPRLKVLLAGGLILAIGITPPTFHPISPNVPISQLHLALAVVLAIGIQVAGVPWRYVAVRLAAIAPFILLLSLSIPLSKRLEGGWMLMSGMLVKALLSFATVLLLVNTTPFDRLLTALRGLGAPGLLVETLSFMYRYVFVLLDELARMSRARAARSFRRRGLARLKDLAGLIGMLLLRSFERAERVHRAMLARGFDGNLKTLDLRSREHGSG